MIHRGDKVKFFNTGKEYEADEVGYLRLKMCPTEEVTTGNVGYIISGIKTAVEVKVGDTITHVDRPCAESIAGFEEVKPMLFAGVYPVETDEYENLRASLENWLWVSVSAAVSSACFIWRSCRRGCTASSTWT